MAAIIDQINAEQWYESVSMLNEFLDPQNICLDAYLICLDAMVSKLHPSKHFHYFGWRPFWKVGKNHVSHARIPWVFFVVDTGTIRNPKLLESVCLQFCLGSPYIWAILTIIRGTSLYAQRTLQYISRIMHAVRALLHFIMMTPSNGNIFRVTGLLCGEFTGPRWIPRTKASDAELWSFLWSAPE